RSSEPLLVRLHSECLTGDVFSSLRCDCGTQLNASLENIRKEGRGVLLYLQQEGRGIGIVNKVQAYHLQDEGRDTVEANLELGFDADQRDFGVGAQMLMALGAHKIRLMTNNPRKVRDLESYGIEVVERVPLEFDPGEHNRPYLEAKRDKLGHLLSKV
ncbi:MAG: GTP cyclohydrolase II, partial [Myxococcota bacterium]|nr:GTP cyclohydrolase II [Myxococcota bacterium]